MHDIDAPDSTRPSECSTGLFAGTPGEAMSWEDVSIGEVVPTSRADLHGRIGEFESAFGSRRGKGEDSGAVANIGKTALMRAAEAGDAESVQRLIDAGANVNATDMSGRTALMWAALGGHAGVVRLLLYAGADAYASHKNGITAFMLAQARGHSLGCRLTVGQRILVPSVRVRLLPSQPLGGAQDIWPVRLAV